MSAIPQDLSYVHTHRVRYRECDPMGVVYHTHYLDYFEVARTEALRSLGLAYREIEEQGFIMPVVDAGIRYHRPARYDDLLDIETDMRLSKSRTRVTFTYEVHRSGDENRLVTGHVTLCFMDMERRRPVPAPDIVMNVISNHSQERLST